MHVIPWQRSKWKITQEWKEVLMNIKAGWSCLEGTRIFCVTCSFQNTTVPLANFCSKNFVVVEHSIEKTKQNKTNKTKTKTKTKNKTKH